MNIGTKPKRAPRILGICADAVRLSVSRQHLQAVLTGRRKGGRALIEGYQALKAKTGQENAIGV